MLGLTKINTVHGRAEDYAKQKGYRESFDFCVSRAVANLSSSFPSIVSHLSSRADAISYKSGSVDQELIQAEKAVKILGGQREEVVRFSLADTDMDRSFVVIHKAKPTPKKYPRKAELLQRAVQER